MRTMTERAPITSHLLELRKRLVIAVIGWLIAMVVCFYFAEDIYRFLSLPLADASSDNASRRLIYTSLTEPFQVYLKIAFYAGFMLAFPLIASQLYIFLAPGLYAHEKWVILPYLIAAPLLFFSGAALAYYFAMPLAWGFFLSFEAPAQQGALPLMLEAKISEYISLVIQFTVAFGLAFQLPILLTLLTRASLLSPERLTRNRKYAVLILLIVAAILTPPDVVSQVLLFTPLYLLYEASIVLCMRIAHTPTEMTPHA